MGMCSLACVQTLVEGPMCHRVATRQQVQT